MAAVDLGTVFMSADSLVGMDSEADVPLVSAILANSSCTATTLMTVPEVVGIIATSMWSAYLDVVHPAVNRRLVAVKKVPLTRMPAPIPPAPAYSISKATAAKRSSIPKTILEVDPKKSVSGIKYITTKKTVH